MSYREVPVHLKRFFCCTSTPETICKLGIANDGVVYATCEYKAKNADELSFIKGKPLKVSRKGDGTESEWWWATVDGQHGYVPQNLLSVSHTLCCHHARSQDFQRVGAPRGGSRISG